eukprot:COSAG01_NODE_1003_length_12216_cov_8.565350_5_plen_85_part_00
MLPTCRKCWHLVPFSASTSACVLPTVKPIISMTTSASTAATCAAKAASPSGARPALSSTGERWSAPPRSIARRSTPSHEAPSAS